MGSKTTILARTCAIPEQGSVLLFGARQTGKTTLLSSRLPEGALVIDLLRRDEWLRYLRHPGALRGDVRGHLAGGREALVFIDEVQKIPDLLDAVHGLIEETGARFWMTGSSARKLRRGQANLLAGRAITRRLHPLTAAEMGPAFDLERALRLGTLPPLLHLDDVRAIEMLRSYADTYLREEIQAEALVRNLGGFARFLDVVAAQDGELLNVSAIARDAGVASRTVQEYVQVLVDTLVALRLEPWTRGVRSRLVRHPKLYLFDTGVGNALRARLGAALTPASRGRLFERWLVPEIIRLLDYGFPEARAYFWRTNHGAEVDLLIEQHGRLRVAIELKCRDHVSGADLSGLRSFAQGWPEVPLVVACTAPRRSMLHGVTVLPYAELLGGLGEWLA